MSTAQEHADRIALALSANPTDGDWELCYLDTPKDEIGAYVQGCVNVSGGDKYHFIRALNADGIQVDVAHYGNGPRSNVNGYFACVANPAAMTALLAERTALLEERAKIREALCCDEHDDQDPLVVIDMIRSWETDAQLKADSLAAHLRLVLEIADTWRPDYATKMDRDTIAGARAALKAKP